MAKACGHPGCPGLVQRKGSSRCPTHDQGAWGGSTRKATLPSNWQALRLQRFELDGWACVDCGLHDPTGRLLECDHDGDRDDHRIESLRTRCCDIAKGGRGCHRRHTSAQAAAGHHTGM